MSEKVSKGYDPTLARMVGNILAGEIRYLGEDNLNSRIDFAIEAANRAVKKLRKQWKDEGRD